MKRQNTDLYKSAKNLISVMRINLLPPAVQYKIKHELASINTREEVEALALSVGLTTNTLLNLSGYFPSDRFRYNTGFLILVMSKLASQAKKCTKKSVVKKQQGNDQCEGVKGLHSSLFSFSWLTEISSKIIKKNKIK